MDKQNLQEDLDKYCESYFRVREKSINMETLKAIRYDRTEIDAVWSKGEIHNRKGT